MRPKRRPIRIFNRSGSTARHPNDEIGTLNHSAMKGTQSSLRNPSNTRRRPHAGTAQGALEETVQAKSTTLLDHPRYCPAPDGIFLNTFNFRRIKPGSNSIIPKFQALVPTHPPGNSVESLRISSRPGLNRTRSLLDFGSQSNVPNRLPRLTTHSGLPQSWHTSAFRQRSTQRHDGDTDQFGLGIGLTPT